jgi:O-antigen/teichoic acid export membrane protein
MTHNKKQQLIKNTLIIALGSISLQLVSFLLLPFYTTHLSTSDYGVVDLITTYNFLLVPIISIQLGMAAFRFLVDARDDESAKARIVSNVLWAASVPAFTSLALFLLIVQFVHIHYAYWSLATIAAAIIPSILLQIARGFGKNSVFAIGSIVSGVTTVILNIVLIAHFHMGARGMLTSGIVASLAGSLYLFFALKLYKYIDFSAGDKNLRKALLRYSLPLIPNGLSWWIIDTSDRTIISLVLGVSSNGIYAVAYKFPTAFSSIYSFFSMSWTESASMHINHKDRDEYFSEVGSASVRFFGSLAAVTIAFIALFFNLFIGQSYRHAYGYIPILIAASFFSSVVGNYSAIYVAKKLTKQVANTSIFSALINILLSIVSIKFIGMYGTALATAVAYLAMAIYRHYDTKKYVSLVYEKNIFLKVALLFGITAGLYYYNHTLLNIANAVIVSVVSLILNRSLVSEAKAKLHSKYRKLGPNQRTVSESI